jgi:hypothetical protein
VAWLADATVRAQQSYIPWASNSEMVPDGGPRPGTPGSAPNESSGLRSRLAQWIDGLGSTSIPVRDVPATPPTAVRDPQAGLASNPPAGDTAWAAGFARPDAEAAQELSQPVQEIPQPALEEISLPAQDAFSSPAREEVSLPALPFDSTNGVSYSSEGAGSYDSFGARIFKAYFGKKEQEEEEEVSHREGEIIPINSPPFPFSDHIGPNIGYRDTSKWPLMEAIYNGPNGDWWKKSRIKIYGWVDPSYNASTSRQSNIPLSYSIVPNSLQLSQAILIFERMTDTVQRENYDWGFKFTNLYGIDYRYTTAKGYFSDQLLKHNNLYGYDPLQMYADLYVPWVAEGMIIRAGRYISPIDIEAQLSPENYLYTHSLMYTYDPYTFTGLQFITRMNKNLHMMLGVHAGNDMAPWTTSSQPNGEILLKWVSDTGNNSLFGGLDSIGHGYYKNGHDDLQVLALTWGHKFTDKLHMFTESYYIWERDALSGGTVTNGPPQPFFPFTGPGTFLPGLSYSIGVVNYTAYQTSDKSYLVFRSDVLDDPRGFRTGFAGAYFEHTLGFIYHITPWCLTRPEIRFDYTTGQKGYDNATRREQFTFSWDIIIRF